MSVVYSYFIFLAISIAVTVRGPYLPSELADSVNHLLVVGFYLINPGYVAFALKTSSTPVSLPALSSW
jgi:hypothetical protein